MMQRQAGMLFSLTLVVGAALIAVEAPPAAAAAHAVAVLDFSFQDAASSGTTTTITAGDSVIWTWSGAAPHTVTSDSPGTELVSGAPQVTGSYSHVFSTPATFHYHCEVHPQMVGTVEVQAATPTSTSTPPPAATDTPGPSNAPVTRTRTPGPTDTPVSIATSDPALMPAPALSVASSPPPGTTDGADGNAQLPSAGFGASGGTTLIWPALALALAAAGSACLVAGHMRRRRS